MKSKEYFEGMRQEEARQAARAGGYAGVAQQVAQHLRRDETRRQRILSQFPHLAMDADELAQSSSRELALRVLDSLGLKAPKDSDPIELLDAYLAGRQHGAQAGAGKASALDGMPSSASFLDKYLGS